MMENMGNPQFNQRGKQSLLLRPPFRGAPRREMNFLPVPLTSFDGGQAHTTTSLSTTLRNQFPHVLLIECMLERMCSIYETEADKQKELYEVIRRHFINFRLLPPYPGFPEMDGLRLRLGSDLNNLFRLAKVQMTNSRQSSASANSLTVALANPSPMSGSVWSISDGSEHLFSSRYELDFKEIGYIAAGGFGVVYRAQNKLDNTEYAIKKIVIGPRSASKILREVHLLSQLHHPNIVAYKSAWLEYCTLQTMQRILQQTDDLLSSSQGVASTVNGSSLSSHDWKVVVNAESSDKIVSYHSDSIVFENENSQETTSQSQNIQSRDVADRSSPQNLILSNLRRPYDRVLSSPAMLLYIQMQLCQQTLRHWLSNRNAVKTELETIDLELSIFRQIVEGVHYIHSRNIIHRDIKPENIFIDATATQVLIGDFGLAVHHFRNEANSNSALSTHMPVREQLSSQGVGTHAYAAPEQLGNKDSDSKSDIYSLGIVFIELLNPFQTVMERYKTIEKLRNHGQIPDRLGIKWPSIAKLILRMISHDQASRPTIGEVKDLLDSKRPTTTKTTTAFADSSAPSNEELLSIIEDLRRQVAEKDLIIEDLMKRNRNNQSN